MKKLLLAALLLFPNLAWAQCSGVFPANTVCGNNTAGPAVPTALSFGGTIAGPGSSVVNDIVTWNNTAGTSVKDSGVLITNVPTINANNTWTGTNTFNNTVSGTGITSLFASPPAIGGTAAASGAFTTLSASSTVSGAGFTSLFASPPSIGNTAASSGAFTTLSASGALTASSTATVTGVTKLQGNAFFGSGAPWVDVKSGANSCAAAVGDGATNDQAAIQCQVTFMNATFGGGTVFFPCANFRITSTVTVPGGVRLQGAGRNCAIISTGNVDTQALSFTGGSNTYGGLRDIWIQCDQTSGVLTNNCVVVGSNVPVVFENFMIWGGNYALQTAGADSSFRDGFVCGVGTSGGCLTSTGASWYERMKFDTIGSTVSNGIALNTVAALAENHFINCDVSGSFSSVSVGIGDTNNNTLTTFTNTVFSSLVNITGAKYTMFVGDEFGVAVANSTNESVVGSFGLTALTFTGAGTRNCSGNGNITC